MDAQDKQGEGAAAELARRRAEEHRRNGLALAVLQEAAGMSADESLAALEHLSTDQRDRLAALPSAAASLETALHIVREALAPARASAIIGD